MIFVGDIAMEEKPGKRSEMPTRELVPRLIHAQEEERRRIAAKLHGDVCQRLALICIQLDSIRAATPTSEEGLMNGLSSLYEEADKISTDIHQLSRELYPSTLERLGLTAVLRRFCADFTKHREISVNFSTKGEEPELDRDMALTLFRIGEECLMNVLKHSGAGTCDVSLSFAQDRVVLEVKDSGIGFEPSVLRTSTGVGLESMRARLRSMSGRLRIDSVPKRGTRVHAEVPINRAAPDRENINPRGQHT
jgi:signal transduction histidine kinase